MQLTVERYWETDKSICGELSVDGEFFSYTLEPARIDPVNAGHPCINAGTFDVVLTQSPHLGYLTPEVVDVPGRTDIRIHIGNAPSNTLGCTLVGSEHHLNWVSNSGETFAKLMRILQAADKIVITYIDPKGTNGPELSQPVDLGKS